MPIAAEFDPDLVLVSAGYDPAIGCPEGEQNVGKLFYAFPIACLKRPIPGLPCLLLPFDEPADDPGRGEGGGAAGGRLLPHIASG